MSRLFADTGMTIVASAAMLLLTILGGRLITATTAPDPVSVEQPASRSCLERPLTTIGAAGVHAVSWICLTTAGVQPGVELRGLPSGGLYSAWLSYLEHPSTLHGGRCASVQLASDDRVAPPSRLDSVVADRDGRVVLSGALTGLLPGGDTVLEILVVDHGTPSAAGASARARQLLAWDRSWSGLPSPTSDQADDSGELLGCAAFWLRGGAESMEH